MKITEWRTLVDQGRYSSSSAFQRVEQDIRAAVTDVVWPPGSDRFTIHPESGKKRGEGNGVVPIKKSFADSLEQRGWELERRAPKTEGIEQKVVKGSRPGAFDGHLSFPGNDPLPFAVEWETGNISSSHRAINRIGLGMKVGYLSGGVLVVPSAALARYLTDRIGNAPELLPYHPLWEEWTFQEFGYFGIVTVEHDAESFDVDRIPKGKDGRAES
ncbi:hypothetical protein ACPEIF_31810 [Streptomyces sp. NPDC012600]|uniref:Restriction endonuclease n=1 Tax=Streptomyces stephensoniae TaxID=3375367 RepID=A0ABU2W331_9ACTN|nr:hypothetical protein [Streptomyces griseus]MDT0492278.1 hypothetical protein [Streptomyces griseus]